MTQQNQNLKQRLIQGLNSFPESWALTPLLGNKAPYRSSWQHESPIDRSQIVAALLDGEIVTYTKEDGSTIQKRIFPQGYGLRTGVISGGIVAVDLDGKSAHPYMLELSGGEELPRSVAFTSGRPGRCQYLFRVPQAYWQGIQTKKFKTGVKGDDGKPEQLELRWDGCQSVLPPSVHPTTGQYRWVEGLSPFECEIAEAPLWLIELMLPCQTVTPKQQPSISATEASTPRLPLISSPIQSWTDIDWALSYLNALSPSRADDYSDWLAVGMALHSVDDSLLLEWDSWSRQSSKYKPGDCDRKWKSFKRTGISIGSLAHMAKQDGWRSPFEQKGQRSNGSGDDGVNYRNGRGFGADNSTSRDRGAATPSGTAVSLCSRIREILNLYDQESLQVNALIDLAFSTGRTYSEINQLTKIIRAEGDLALEVIEAVKSFQGTLKSCRKRLDIQRYLDSSLASLLIAKARAMPTAPEYLFNTLLPAAASRIGSSSRVIVNPEGGYKQPCIFWTANVANSGQAKTPPQEVIIEALDEMEASAYQQYERESELYESGDGSSKPPKRLHLLLKDTTTATKFRIHGDCPRGLLEYIDELMGDYERLNQFKGGKGDDLRLELSFWGGGSCNYNRSDARLYLKRTAISKTGTYQWDTLARLMQDEVNFISSGYSARFLYCSIIDAPPRYLNLFSDYGGNALKEKLRWLYGELGLLPQADYFLSHEAKVLFQGWNHALVNADIEEAYFGLSLAYAKIESYTARLALWLHLVNAVLRGEKPAPVISGTTMQHAIEIASFYLWQHKLIHAHNSPTRSLEGIFLKVQTQAEKFFAKCGKGVGASFLKTRINALKGWVVEKIRTTVFKALVNAGHGRTEGEGADMVYIPNTLPGDLPPDGVGGFGKPNGHGGAGGFNAPGGIGGVGAVGGELVVPPIAESIANTEVQSTIGEIGDDTIPDLFSNQPSCELELDCTSQDHHQFTNSMAEPVAISSLQPIGDHQLPHQLPHTLPILDPPSGDRGSPVTPTYNSPSRDDGSELLNDEETAAWHKRLNACQTLDDALEFHTALASLSKEQRDQLELTIAKSKWVWLWNLPEASASAPFVVEPESKPEPQQTVTELKALLLACDSRVQLNELKRKHRKVIDEAYSSMSEKEQSHIDALLALAVPYKVFKYLGEEIKLGQARLLKGTLVYLDPRTQVRANAYSLPVWAIDGVANGQRKPINVSVSLMQEVVKALKPTHTQDGDTDQLGLI